MTTIQEQIHAIKEEIKKTPYHKATEHHIGRLRAKLSRLKEKEIESSVKKSGGGGGSARAGKYAIKKQGDATVVLVGPPSAGKSTLLNRLTNAQSKVAPYAFTTVSVIPGMMHHKDAYIQILDVPGLIEGAETGKGRGREVLSVARGADLLIIISDTHRPKALKRIAKSLEENGIRINKTPPKVTIEKKHTGGLIIHTNIKQPLKITTIKEIARELGLKNAEITINEEINIQKLLDAFSRNRVYIPSIAVLNKADVKKAKNTNHDLTISAQTGLNLDRLKDSIWEKLELVRVYLVRRDEEPSNKNPFITKEGATLKDIAVKIGSDFAENHKRAIIWGPGAKFPAQEVSLTQKAIEGMQIRFV